MIKVKRTFVASDGPAGAYKAITVVRPAEASSATEPAASGEPAPKKAKVPAAAAAAAVAAPVAREATPVAKKKLLYKKTLDGSFLFSSSRTQRTVYPDGSLIGACGKGLRKGGEGGGSGQPC